MRNMFHSFLLQRPRSHDETDRGTVSAATFLIAELRAEFRKKNEESLD